MKKGAMVLGALLLATAAFALGSESAGYRMPTEAVTQGGGTSGSHSYLAPQQALGQSVSGSQSSSSYLMRVGVLQPVSEISTNPTGWQLN